MTPPLAADAAGAGREPIRIAGTTVAPGGRARLELPVARLVTGTWLSLPLTVLHGRHPGPSLCLCAAVHGDELDGVEIIRRLLAALDPAALHGTVLAVPIVNVFGFIHGSRYTPDRRDLNRSFPGSARGSMAARIAHLFMTEVLARCDYGIDLHTGSHHRVNLPQVRADLEHPPTRALARAFGAPLALNARTRDGSLRAAARERGVPLLLFEGGEPHRFSEDAIQAGVRGVRGTMTHLRMVAPDASGEGAAPGEGAEPPLRAERSRWVRAARSGVFRQALALGARVAEAQSLGTITDVFGDAAHEVRSPLEGVVIGHTTHPLVNRGDALVHVAEAPQPLEAEPLR